jgi:transcriptional regulator with XRE-family HTH domain
MKNEIGQKIRHLRKSKGLTQQELGEKFGVSAAAIGGYERGRRMPSIKTLEKIAVFFGVGLEYFGVASQDEIAEVLARARTIFENNSIPAAEKDELYRELMKLYLSITDNKGK